MEVSQISDARQEELRKATLEDPTMQKLTDQFVVDGRNLKVPVLLR